MKVIKKNAIILISKLRNWKDNPRLIKKVDLERLKSQIKELGIYKPLLVCGNGKGYDVIGGNMRLKALKELGFNKADCWILKFKNKKEKVKISMSDNDRAGYYDEKSLAALIAPFRGEISLENFKVELKAPDIDLNKILSNIGPKEVAEIEITEELFESHNYVVLYFDNDLDWQVAKDVFKLKTKGALDSRKGYERTGLGRVIRGDKILKKLL